MKKVLALVAISLLNAPVVYAESAKLHHKHHYKHRMKHAKRMHHRDNKRETIAIKDAAATPPTPPAAATSGWSGNFVLASNYIFRGISQSENNPAVQGGITYTFPIGLYGNVWGSSARFNAPDGRVATTEMDVIAGLRNTFWEDFTYDINLSHYTYPGARTANYNELNTLFIYKILQFGISYTPNYSGTHGHATYYSGQINYDIPEKYLFHVENVTLQAGMGHTSFARAAGNSYNNYLVGLNKKINDTYAISLQWTGTNGRANLAPFDDNQITGTVTASF